MVLVRQRDSGMHHEQDMRRWALNKYMPTHLTFLAGCWRLRLFRLAASCQGLDLWNAAARVIPSLARLDRRRDRRSCTAFTTRLSAMTFWGKKILVHPHDHTPSMKYLIMISDAGAHGNPARMRGGGPSMWDSSPCSSVGTLVLC